MLQLTLRKEFQGRRLKGTAIELANSSNTGATQIAAEDFLEITYPSTDALTAIEAVGAGHGRPLVLIGDRGQGKSHLMAMLYHAFTAADAARTWLTMWADRLGNAKLAELPLRGGMHVISESLHRQSYRFLWDLLFDRHPHGPEVRGMWKGRGDRKTDVPSYDLLLELFRHTPTALVLDEVQTWYDGLTNTRQYPWRSWAFNFVQLLSEIAKEHPDLLVLVVSVRNGDTDARFSRSNGSDRFWSTSRARPPSRTGRSCSCTVCSKTACRSQTLRYRRRSTCTSRSTCGWRRRHLRSTSRFGGSSSSAGPSLPISCNSSRIRSWSPRRRKRRATSYASSQTCSNASRIAPS